MNQSSFASRVLCASIAVVLTAIPGLSLAGPKEDALATMQALSQQINAAKAQGQDASGAIAELNAISSSLGGDLPNSAAQQGAAPRGGILAPPNCAVTTTEATSTDTPIAITDNASFTSNLSIAGAPAFLHTVRATLNITHTFPGDLDITLTSAAGTVITLTTDNGGSADDAFAPVLFSDTAGITVTDATYTISTSIGAVVPESAMAAFRGEDPNGTWVLSVGDDAGGDTGTLQTWSLQIVSGDDVPTDTVTSFASTDVPLAILDNATGTSTLQVSGTDAFTCAVQLNTNITHTFPGDLDMFLMSPATSTTISTDNGGSADDAFDGTQWYDQAGSPATDFTYTTSVTATPLVPEGAMGAFTGTDPNGTWSLMIGDDAGGDTGSLNAWSVDVTTCSCAAGTPLGPVAELPSGSLWSRLLLILLALGLGTLALSRRFRRS